jgi:hypothetical protein
VAWNFKFVDDSGVYYEWDTTIDPEGVYSGQKWLVKMTVIREDECLDFPYKIVNRVKFIKKIVKEI